MTYLLNHPIALCISFNPGKSHIRYYTFFSTDENAVTQSGKVTYPNSYS